MPISQPHLRDSIRVLLPTGRDLTSQLSQISVGTAAQELLSRDGQLQEGAIVALPQFLIRDYQGSESVNRFQWDCPTVVHVPSGKSATLRWKVEDSSLDELSGTITVTSSSEFTEIGSAGDALPAEAVTDTSVISDSHARRVLKGLVRTGNDTTFALLRALTPYAREAVHAASLRVYREINGLDLKDRAAHVIDQVEQETVVDELMLGAERDGSVGLRLIRRTANTNVTVRKSVVLYIATALWTGAETKVRAHIGDPHMGRVIRRLARQMQTLTPTEPVAPEDVLEAYREQYPEQQIGITRIVDALTAGATVHTQMTNFQRTEGHA